MVRFTISTDDLDAEIEELLEEFLLDVSVDMTNFLKEEMPVDKGELRQSTQILSHTPTEVVIGIKAKHAVPIALGTEPFWPPIEPLKGWARRNLGAERAAYAVQQSIAEEGIEADPYHERAIDRLEAKYG